MYRIVASTNMCYYSENQIFGLLSKWAEKKDTWQMHDVFVKYLSFQLIQTTFIFDTLCY